MIDKKTVYQILSSIDYFNNNNDNNKKFKFNKNKYSGKEIFSLRS